MKHSSARRRWAPLARALLDYHRGATGAWFTVHSDLWRDETTPVEDFYRPDHQPIPEIERRALALCRGRVLDLGAGAGRHALELQRNGLDVVAVDISAEAVEIMRDRGVADPRCGDHRAVAGEAFDTVLMLMHGIGLVGTLAGLDHFLDEVMPLLTADGQIVFDTADLGVVMPEIFDERMKVWRAGGMYPGEVEFQLSYGELVGDAYPWLFIDPRTLALHADKNGLRSEVIARGTRGAYLARMRT